MIQKTLFVQIKSDDVDYLQMNEIRRVLSSDGLIIFPTETFYGLGGNCYSKTAIQKIFQLKQRETSKALSVVISDLSMLEKVVHEIPPLFEKLRKKFWPGPLTLVFKASKDLPLELLGASKTIAVRLPDFTWLRSLIHFCGFPLTATSANISGQQNIANAESAYKFFKGKIEMVIDGGETPGNLPSTIVDLTLSQPRLLREGVIPKEILLPYLE